MNSQTQIRKICPIEAEDIQNLYFFYPIVFVKKILKFTFGMVIDF